MEDIKPIDKFTLDKYVKEEDDLLEYVKQVAMEFCPDVYEGTYIPIIQNVYLILDLPDSYQYLCYR